MMPTPDQVREFVIAGHGNLPKVQALLAENPALLNVAHAWSETDHETAIQAAAHVGARPVAVQSFALPPTAAMLGRTDDVKRLLTEDPSRITEQGAHFIPLLPHAALSGDVELMALLHSRGATEGGSFALGNAVSLGYRDAARWLLSHAHPDLSWKDFRDKTPLEIATERGDTAMIELLERHAATSSHE